MNEMQDSGCLRLRWNGQTSSEQPASDEPEAFISLDAAGDMRIKPVPGRLAAGAAEELFPGRRLVTVLQEHTTTVHIASGDFKAGERTGDGLLTNNPDILLGVTVADCMPIYLWDPEKHVRGILHSGWKGTGILRNAVRLMNKEYRSRMESVRVILGPAIGSCCYAVPEERAETFGRIHGDGSAVRRNGIWYIDLAAANRNILAAEGIANVFFCGICSSCDRRFGSYRRQGSLAFTRMLALV